MPAKPADFNDTWSKNTDLIPLWASTMYKDTLKIILCVSLVYC